MRIEVDSEVCVGGGHCVRTLPELFEQDGDGTVRVLLSDVPADRRSGAAAVADLCPSGAIKLIR
ncbi:ferredoxin [Streptomyces sp. NPDC005538]|uniref:ferredoxin n=1 Tax=unclassified Streptomyces TaxID=2593676 RepID=UPI0033A38A23